MTSCHFANKPLYLTPSEIWQFLLKHWNVLFKLEIQQTHLLQLAVLTLQIIIIPPTLIFIVLTSCSSVFWLVPQEILAPHSSAAGYFNFPCFWVAPKGVGFGGNRHAPSQRASFTTQPSLLNKWVKICSEKLTLHQREDRDGWRRSSSHTSGMKRYNTISSVLWW